MLSFEKLILHNFGSYSHAELDLQNKGFCLVTGQNKFKKDNAVSNGSGKSFLWNAICFALVGETISGLHTNLKNINITDDPACYVTLIFSDNADHYQITRHITPKSDLKVIKNDVDLSGKGIRESEKKLTELLPDLTKNLITSTIIIGQGMPNKFSSFSPSGRKELLEKLTRADFMIEDIKQRVSTRLTTLTNEIRNLEDARLARQSQINVHNMTLSQKISELNGRQKPAFDDQLDALAATITDLDTKLSTETLNLANTESSLNLASNELFALNSEKSKELDVVKAEADNASRDLVQQQATVRAEIQALRKQISQYESIKDTCPTCGQHLPGAHKPDTTELHTQLDAKVKNQAIIEEALQKHTINYQAKFTEVSSGFEQKLQDVQTQIEGLKTQLNSYRNSIKAFETSKNLEQQALVRLQYEKETWDAYTEALKLEIVNLQTTLSTLSNELTSIEESLADRNEHLKLVRKMDSLIKRDFRGFLLANIITYIDKKAKDYCNIVFGTRDLEVSLDNNDLNISYCGKMFDNLSGGEKQRVDLILQFAIRNMLTAYLNFNSNILVLDEITDFLDKKSCTAILDLITQELNTIESVFVISHHASALALPIDSEMVIQKNELGISEIISGV